MVSSQLFELIRSLSPAEKAYFKRFAHKQHKRKASPYLQLFDAIDRQKKYEEGKLQAGFQKFGISGSFPAAKNYLYNLLLHCLTDFHAGKSPEDKLARLMQEIHFLKEKKLFPQAAKKIRAATKIAEEHDFYEQKVLLLNMERQLLPFQPKTFEQRMALLQKMETALDEKHNYVQYRQLYEEMVNLTHRFGWLVKKEDQRKLVREKLAHPLLRDSHKALTFLAKFNLHNTLTSYYLMLSDWPNTVLQSRLRLTLFEEFPKYKQLWEQNYLVSLDNHLRLLITAELLDDFDATASELETALTKVKDPSEHLLRHGALVQHRMNRLQKEFRFREALALIPELEKSAPPKFHNTGMIISRKFFIARVCFYNGKFESALDYLNESLNNKALSIFPDFHFYTELLTLLTHYQLGNIWLLESLIRSLTRLFQKLERDYAVEKTLIRLLPKLPDISSKKENQQLFQQFLKKIEPLREDALERLAFHYFDFVLWAKSQLAQKPIVELFP